MAKTVIGKKEYALLTMFEYLLSHLRTTANAVLEQNFNLSFYNNYKKFKWAASLKQKEQYQLQDMIDNIKNSSISSMREKIEQEFLNRFILENISNNGKSFSYNKKRSEKTLQELAAKESQRKWDGYWKKYFKKRYYFKWAKSLNPKSQRQLKNLIDQNEKNFMEMLGLQYINNIQRSIIVKELLLNKKKFSEFMSYHIIERKRNEQEFPSVYKLFPSTYDLDE